MDNSVINNCFRITSGIVPPKHNICNISQKVLNNNVNISDAISAGLKYYPDLQRQGTLYFKYFYSGNHDKIWHEISVYHELNM